MPKRIRDPLYGFIEIPDEYRHIVDHKIMQRLRWVNQLPLEQLVYPAAQHSRFEHSLGTMHLARKAAECLVRNSSDKFLSLAKEDILFREITAAKRKELFVRCAGLVGLLHDVGHAPFSHTMEDACSYTENSPFKYNHERIGCALSKRLLEEIKPHDKTITIIVSKVLNKKINDVSRGPVEILLKNLVDGSIDTDKGDYVRRDSYHCGVVYGVYDADRLWDNIIITDTNTIGINEKGALESWSLRLARYKMNKNVYKHHVRHITDALLIEIISMAFSKTASDPARQKKILPFEDENACQLENNIVRFCFWNDNTLLDSLNGIEDSKITHRIESFMARNLYKRCFVINLTRDYPEIVLSGPYSESAGCIPALHKKIREIQESYSNSGINFNYILDKDSPPPVFEDDVQKKIRIYTNKEYVPLAEFLGFKVNDHIYSMAEGGKNKKSEDRGLDTSFLCDHYLRIFVQESDIGCRNELKNSICSSLSEFSVQKSVTKELSA